MTADGVILQNVDRIVERGIKLGIIKAGYKPSISEILYIDMIWRVLTIGQDLDTQAEDFEIKHKKMLQYGNLNKILATLEQVKAKKNDAKKEDGIFAQVVKKYAEEEKKALEEETKKLKEKFPKIYKKAMKGETLTEEEQMIYDAGMEAGEVGTEVGAGG